MRELLSHGANVNAVDCNGFSALILSSYNCHVEVVRVLLAAGADKHHVNRNGHTATTIASFGDKQGARAAILALLAAAP